MKIREILQIEIWSKKTSRKIIVCLGILIAGISTWAAIEQYWLSPGERKAGRIALAQIDGLQSFALMSDQDFDAQSREADKQIAAAEGAAWTTRDRLLALDLTMYSELTKIDREDLKRRKLIEQRFPWRSLRDAEFAAQIVATGEKTRLAIRIELQSALGK